MAFFQKSNFAQKPIENYIFCIFRNHKNPKIVFFQWFLIKNELGRQKNIFFHFLHLYKQKMKKIMIFCDDSFLQFRVHLDPIFIKISRIHTLPQEKLVTKVILITIPFLDSLARGMTLSYIPLFSARILSLIHI